MKLTAIIALLVLALVAVAAVRCVVFVDEAEFVIITQFGRHIGTHGDAGLHFKLPYQSALRIDKRIQIYDPRPSEFLASDKKTVNLDVYACWAVVDPKRFLETVGDKPGAEARLHDLVWSELRAEVGRRELEALVSTDAAKHQLDRLVEALAARCAERAEAAYGIQIEDLQLKRISPPAQVRDSVFGRMRSERARVARQLRAEGEEKALEIRADAQKTRSETLAAAYRDAEILRGQAEADATRIYAAAHQKDPQFYELVRTLEAYRKFLDEKTTILLSADSDLLKFLTRGPAASDEKPRK
jgi:membrane protease subunit HflC